MSMLFHIWGDVFMHTIYNYYIILTSQPLLCCLLKNHTLEIIYWTFHKINILLWSTAQIWLYSATFVNCSQHLITPTGILFRTFSYQSLNGISFRCRGGVKGTCLPFKSNIKAIFQYCFAYKLKMGSVCAAIFYKWAHLSPNPISATEIEIVYFLWSTHMTRTCRWQSRAYIGCHRFCHHFHRQVGISWCTLSDSYPCLLLVQDRVYH